MSTPETPKEKQAGQEGNEKTLAAGEFEASEENRSGMIVTVDRQDDEKAVSSQDQQGSEFEDAANWGMDEFADSTNRSMVRELQDCINTIRFNCGMLVNNSKIQFLIVLLIAVNAIMMGIATFPIVKDNPSVLNTFEIVDQVFLIIFTVEIAMQAFYLGWRLLLDGWLDFDLIIIITSWSFSSVQIIRAFRIFRALRLVTRIKIMKNLLMGELLFSFPKKRVLVYKQQYSSPFLVSISALLFLSSLWSHATYGSNRFDAFVDLLHFCCHVNPALQGYV